MSTALPKISLVTPSFNQARFLGATFDSVFAQQYPALDYVVVKLETEKHPQSIALSDDPYVLIRPEGKWDTPGILERSARRGISLSASP